ncbi:MAG: hypothetical protein EP330_17880 [Deltaproteobacteria bacterium]|nr:MAG: hypothetical protein EP330_17880 [Deltaproteobacteria bacterium]
MRSPLLLGVALLAACTGDQSIRIQNVAPSVSITSPITDAVFEEAETITFTGVIQDDRPIEDLSYRWASSVDGELPTLDVPDAEGNVELVTANLSAGVHVIELQAIDGDGLDGSDNITITIEEIPELPSIRVIVPTGGSSDAPQSLPFIMLANVSDAQDPPDQLVVTVSDDSNGLLCYAVPDGNGDAQCTYTWDTLGNYLVTFQVEDTDGNTARANLAIRVVDPLDFDADGDGYSPNGGDCNDSNINVYPGADEICDGLDNDCIGTTAIDQGTDCYDDDGDGYCESPPCTNTSGTPSIPDCDDGDASRYPDPTVNERVNGVDDDCDGVVDENTSVYDDDGDGFCESGNCVNANGTQPDCDDGNTEISPAATENCATAYDDNCDGLSNNQNATGCTNYYYDQDGDGYGLPGSNSQCWCSGGSAPYTGTNTNDCYDQNANARPNQTGWFASHRGDGSFDYNCDNAQEKRYNGRSSPCYAEFAPFTCETNSAGWSSSEPACGGSGTYVPDCSNSYDAICMAACLITGTYLSCTQCYTCDERYNTQQQQCR